MNMCRSKIKAFLFGSTRKDLYCWNSIIIHNMKNKTFDQAILDKSGYEREDNLGYASGKSG